MKWKRHGKTSYSAIGTHWQRETEVQAGMRRRAEQREPERHDCGSGSPRYSAHWTSARGEYLATGLSRCRVAGLGIERVALVVWWVGAVACDG
jgi:hypothetical protein